MLLHDGTFLVALRLVSWHHGGDGRVGGDGGCGECWGRGRAIAAIARRLIGEVPLIKWRVHRGSDGGIVRSRGASHMGHVDMAHVRVGVMGLIMSRGVHCFVEVIGVLVGLLLKGTKPSG